MRAPAPSYAKSATALPSPAPVSTTTSWPRWTSSRAPAGVKATRYSSVLISFGTPIFTARHPIVLSERHAFGALSAQIGALLAAIVDLEGGGSMSPTLDGWGVRRSPGLCEVEQQADECLRVL